MEAITVLALSWQHLLIVAVIILVLFGGRKIPEMMRGLGSGIKEFKDAVKEDDKVNVDPVTPVNTQTTSAPLNPVTPQVNPTVDPIVRPTDSAGNPI